MMKKILAFFLLAGMSLSATFADLVETNSSTSATDIIEELTKTIEKGSYTQSTRLDEKLQTSEQENKLIFIPKTEYSRIGVNSTNKIYTDSEIWYVPDQKEFVEIKDFPKNIRMIRSLVSNVASVIDVNEENTTEEMWYVSCSVDHITEEKTCGLGKYELVFLRSSKHGLQFSVSKEVEKLNTYKYHYLRVDKNQVFKTKTLFSGKNLQNIISQMKNGRMVYTRFYEWSDSYEENVPLNGFATAYEIMNKMYAKLK